MYYCFEIKLDHSIPTKKRLFSPFHWMKHLQNYFTLNHNLPLLLSQKFYTAQKINNISRWSIHCQIYFQLPRQIWNYLQRSFQLLQRIQFHKIHNQLLELKLSARERERESLSLRGTVWGSTWAAWASSSKCAEGTNSLFSLASLLCSANLRSFPRDFISLRNPKP